MVKSIDNPSPQKNRPQHSPRMLAWFETYLQWYMPKRLHAVRLSRSGVIPAEANIPGPRVMYLNHPSWWDPLVCVLLARKYFPAWNHFAAMDAKALEKYRFFERMGFFGVDQDSKAGVRKFLQKSDAILSDTNSAVWITAQGEFTDPRTRPVTLRPGVAHMIERMTSRMKQGTILPLALEFPHWQERDAEALMRIAPMIDVTQHATLNAKQWLAFLTQQLTQNMETLASEAMTRDPKKFEIILRGQSGVGGIYDVWRRSMALLRGQKFTASHGDE